MTDTYTTIYYKGGTDYGTWHKCLPVLTKDEAVAQVLDMRKMGYFATYHITRQLNSIGMPDGAPNNWDFTTLTAKRKRI